MIDYGSAILFLILSGILGYKAAHLVDYIRYRIKTNRCPKPFGTEHDKKICRRLHNLGVELTPEQIRTNRITAYNIIRYDLEAQGWSTPESDEELYHLIQEGFRSNRPGVV